MVSWHLLFIRKLNFFLRPYLRPGGARRAGPAAWAGMQGLTRAGPGLLRQLHPPPQGDYF